jgi:CHAD domain-containing protein
MLRQGLSAYYQELDRAFHLCWMEALRDYDDETAHRLRVNLKRQYAFFHLLQALDARFSAISAMESFATLYRKAGKVRNKQVESQLILNMERRLHLVFALSGHLAAKADWHGKVLQEWERTHSLEPVRALSAKVLKHIHQLPENDIASKLNTYLLNLSRAIGSFPSILEEDSEALHDLRKFIKELFYNLEVLRRLFPGVILHLHSLNLLDDFQHLLGDWHDRVFSIEHLSKVKFGVHPELMARLVQERGVMEVEIRHRLPTLAPGMRPLEEHLELLIPV